MWNSPSSNGIGSRDKTSLRIERKEPEKKVTTQNPKPTTPSPRGHA